MHQCHLVGLEHWSMSTRSRTFVRLPSPAPASWRPACRVTRLELTP